MPVTTEVFPSLPRSLTFADFAVPSASTTMMLSCESSRKAVAWDSDAGDVGRSIVPVTAIPDFNRYPGFARIASTVKFVEPGCTWPRTALTRPSIAARRDAGDGDRDRRAAPDSEDVFATKR